MYLQHACRAGISAPEAARVLQSRGARISAATVGRRYQELRGNVRSSSKAVRAMARPVAPPPPVQAPADAAKLAELLQEQAAEAEAEIVPWLAELLAADVADGADVVFRMLPAALLAELAADEHVVSALATIALVASDDGEIERAPHIAAARDLLVAAAGELAGVHAGHFADDEPEAEEPTS